MNIERAIAEHREAIHELSNGPDTILSAGLVAGLEKRLEKLLLIEEIDADVGIAELLGSLPIDSIDTLKRTRAQLLKEVTP